MLKIGDWVLDTMGELGFIDSKKNGNRFNVIFPKNERIATRFRGELELAPITLENEDIHTLQALAVETNDSEWFASLGKGLKFETHLRK